MLQYNKGGEAVKKILHIIALAFLWILAFIFSIAFFLFLIFILPLDYLKYKHSPYYKIEKNKYCLFAASGIQFKMYNEIIKNQLPIKYYGNSQDDSCESGWFVFENTLIIPNIFKFEFDSKSGTWIFYGENKNGKQIIMTLDEYIQLEMQDANEFYGQEICNRGVVLIDADDVLDLENAKKDNRFLVNEHNREEALKRFCKTTK